MLFLINLVLSLSLSEAFKDFGLLRKSPPSISSSLVNLGKIDISFIFPGNHDLPSSSHTQTEISPILKNVVSSFSHPLRSHRHSDEVLSNPSNIFNKLFTNNDLFSIAEDAQCCDSHENTMTVQKPKLKSEYFIFPSNFPTNHEAIRIFFSNINDKEIKKDKQIRIVGDKSAINDIKAKDKIAEIHKLINNKSNQVNDADKVVAANF